MRAMRLSASLLFAASLTACDSGSSTSPTQRLDTDRNVVQVTTGGLAGYSTAGTGYLTGGGFAPALNAMYPSACTYNDETQFFDCPPVSSHGLNIVRKYRLLDASGGAVSTADPLTVVALRAVIDVQGTMTTGMQINRHEDNTLSGLQSANRVLNGTATQDLTIHGSDGRTVDLMTHDVTVTTDLSILNSIDQKYPLGGTIVSDGTMTYGSGASEYSFPYHREVSFDGTSVMTVKQSFGGGSTMTCRINLIPSAGNPTTCVSGTGGL